MTDFEVVYSDFPVPQKSILEGPFTVANQIIINYQRNKIIIAGRSKVIIQPRTKTMW